MENTAYNTGRRELVTKSQRERGSDTDSGDWEAEDRFLRPTRSILFPKGGCGSSAIPGAQTEGTAVTSYVSLLLTNGN